jgi:hypothetical protein
MPLSLPVTQSSGPVRILQRHAVKLVLGLLAFALALGEAPTVDAKPRKTKAQARSTGKRKNGNGGASQGNGRSASEALARAKVAVLPFEGEQPEALRKHVIKLFKDRGMQVDSTLKPQDNAIQYRDMGAALNLSVYVHGKIKDTGPEHAVVTVTIRSAVTGRPVAKATFNGFRRGLPYDVEEKLWERVAPAFKRACVEASKPNRRHSKPTHIEAGTPL